jgi:hypothetical protein
VDYAILVHKSWHRVAGYCYRPRRPPDQLQLHERGTSFYNGSLGPLFQKKGGIVYILPDTKRVDDACPQLRLLPYVGATT